MTIPSAHKLFIWLPILILFGVLQLLFINADPHQQVSTSRGPFTDEGLNTCQARNFVNHGHWGMDEGDNLIKSPLFNGYLAGVMTIFGSDRTTARLSVFIGSLFLISWFGFLIGEVKVSALFILIGGFQYHLFQFFHFSMVEMLVNSCILISLGFAYRYLVHLNTRDLLWSFLWIYFVFLLKIQYAYLLPLPFVLWAIAFFKAERPRVKMYMPLVFLLMSTLGALLLFYLGWYLPNREIFETVWAHQGTDRFAAPKDWWETFSNSGKYLVWNELNLFFAISFVISIPVGILIFLKSNHSLKPLLVLSMVWLLFEFHKTVILFLPTRYALSLFAAMALWISTVILIGAAGLSKRRYLSFFSLAAILLPLAFGHFRTTSLLLREKSHQSQQIINTYNQLDFKGQTVAGVWATSLIWNETAYVIPVWKNFLNDNQLLKTRTPPLVITEDRELDSEGVFVDRGIDLSATADSLKSYEYGPYRVHFYFLSY